MYIHPGETAEVTIKVINPDKINGSVRVEVRVKNDLNAVIMEDSKVINEIANSDSKAIFELVMRNVISISYGYYILEAEVYNSYNERIGYKSEELRLSTPYIKITPEFPPTWTESSKVEFTISNKGIEFPEEMELECSIYRQNTGENIWNKKLKYNKTEIINLTNNNRIKVDVNLNWENVSAGEYRFYYTLRYNGRAYNYDKEIEGFKYIIRHTLDKSKYKQGDTVKGEVTINYGGEIENFSNITAAISFNGSVLFGAGWRKKLFTKNDNQATFPYSMAILSNASPGTYEIKIEVTREGTVLARLIDNFYIPDFELDGEIKSIEGNSAGIEFKNIGGVKGTGKYKIELRDEVNACPLNMDKKIELLPGNVSTEIINFDNEYRTGEYYLKLGIYKGDGVNEIETKSQWEKIKIDGIKASLNSAVLNETIYSTTQIGLQIDLKNESSYGIADAKLKIKVSTPYLKLGNIAEKKVMFTLNNAPENISTYELSNGERWWIWSSSGEIKLRRFKDNSWDNEETIVSGGNNSNPIIYEEKPGIVKIIYEKQNAIYFRMNKNYSNIWGEEKLIGYYKKGDYEWEIIESGDNYNIGIKRDGTLWAWGYNGEGQLGDSTNINKNIPVQIGIDKDWTKISAGGAHTAAIKRDNSLWAWGANSSWAWVGPNSSGQLGDGTNIDKNIPVR